VKLRNSKFDRATIRVRVVRVEPSNNQACTEPERLVQGVSLTSIGLAHPANGRRGGLKHLNGLIRRTSIADDVLDGRVGLAFDRG
jgi:hypothetical protein